MNKIIFFCTHCGSTDVLLDAFAEWDVAAQDWVLRAVLDQAYCENCGGECRIASREATAEEIAQ